MPRKKNKRKAVQAKRRAAERQNAARRNDLPNPPGIAGPGLGLAMALVASQGLRRLSKDMT